MKIALLQCPVWGTYDPPLALAQLSGCLKQAGHQVSCFDFNIRFYINRTLGYKDAWAWEQSLLWYNAQNVEKFFNDNDALIKKYLSELVDTQPKMIGFSVNAASKLSSLHVARAIKNIKKDIAIVFGGPLFFEKKFIEEILHDDAIDIVVPGEGEITFAELAQHIETGRNINSCAGIAFKDKGNIAHTKPRPLMSNLDILPFLDFSDLPLSRYDDSRHIVFMASRGCVQRCAFCSSRAFWQGYRTMSGKRIFEEVRFHKQQEEVLNPHLGHVDFIDLMFNGNMKYLVEFCDLMIKANLDIKWSANMIIRPEMTKDVVQKMKDSGCEHIIFGIESGSQRVLDLMKKHYNVADADRVIRDMHRAGIRVTGNFMFGFPGETEEDFKMTLEFIKRNAGSLDRAYPSRTYCAIEEFSYLAGHLEEFGIKPNPPNHLFWESVDGTNTYPERLRRCREFSQLASSLGIEVGCGVQTSVDLDEFFNLYLYYEQRKDIKNALGYLLKYFESNRLNGHVKHVLKFYLTKVNEQDPLFAFDEEKLSQLKKAVSIIEREERMLRPEPKKEKPKSEEHFAGGRDENTALNDLEFQRQEIILKSTPKTFFIEVNGPMSTQFIFGLPNADYDIFSLKAYRPRFEEKLSAYFSRAEEIVLFGHGELFLLPESETILKYFDEHFPQARKVITTDGVNLSANVREKILNSKSEFTIRILLPAANRDRYSILTHRDMFAQIIQQLEYLVNEREKSSNLTVHLVFVATTLNIDDLPRFVKLAADLGVDKVICRYNDIYNPVQTYLSCVFRQPTANWMIGEAEEIAKKLNIPVALPPRFFITPYPDLGICRAPWSQVMFDTRGKVLLCERGCECGESLELRNFIDIWNGDCYQKLRKVFMKTNCPRFDFCIQANPPAVNTWDAHMSQLKEKAMQIC